VSEKPRPFAYTADPARIPTSVLVSLRDGAVLYGCPDPCWRDHLNAWRRERRAGRTSKPPQPMPAGHLMFADPAGHGCVPFGCTDPDVIRAAHEAVVRAELHGWDRPLLATSDGRDRLERIVQAVVDARMAGRDVGAAPFLACLLADM
jgi:hypothetical protein